MSAEHDTTDHTHQYSHTSRDTTGPDALPLL